VKLAEAFGVAYGTINPWKNGHIQPSSLALRQIQTLVDEFSHCSSEVIQDRSKGLLAQYFSKEG
jgi:putative transcriptional regulator